MFLSAVTVGLLSLVVILWLRWRKRNFTTFEKLGIPGPQPNIFFGNMLEIRRKGPIQAQADWIRKYGKVLGFYYGFRPVLLVADVDVLKEIEIKKFSNFVNRAELFSAVRTTSTSVFSEQLVGLKGQRWKEVRSIMTPAFTSGKMKQMTELMNRVVDNLVQEIKLKEEKEFDIYNLYQGLTMDVIGQTALGVESGVQKNDDHFLMRACRLIFSSGHVGWIFTIARSFLEFQFILSKIFMIFFAITRGGAKNPILQLTDFCVDVIRQRKADPSKRRGDLLQGLIDAEGTTDAKKIDDQSLTALEGESEQTEKKDSHEKISSGSKRNLSEREITANALLALLAGYETTSTTLAFTTFYLAKDPEIQDKLHEEIQRVLKMQKGDISYSCLQEMKYTEQVIQEALRICPPIFMFVTRESTEDTEIKKWKIPKGMAVMVPVYFLHHDPDHWEEPEKFDPERFHPEKRFSQDPMVWQPFGAGPRNCIGVRFAMMETKMVLAKVILNYRLVPGVKMEKDAPVLSQGIANLTPLNRVHVRAISREVQRS